MPKSEETGSEMFCRKAILKTFVKFSEKHVSQLGTAVLLIKEFFANVSLRIVLSFSE